MPALVAPTTADQSRFNHQMDALKQALAADPSNIGSAVAGETTSKGWTDPPDINPDDNFWFEEVGSSLAFGSNSSIAINGCSYMGSSWLNPWIWWIWTLKPELHDRRGDACFDGSFTGNAECVGVLYPSTPCPWSWTRTTMYAKIVETPSGVLLWLVSDPGVWVLVGEDGWDDITLRGDKEAN